MRAPLAWLSLALVFGYVAFRGDGFRASEPESSASAGQAGIGPSGDAGDGGSAPSEGGSAPSEGGSASEGGTPAEAGGASGAGPIEPPYTVTQLLDDMEDGDSELKNSNGDWYMLRDESAGVITPPQGQSFTMTLLAPPRGKSTRAAHVEVTGFTGWGAAVGFDFTYVNLQRQPYDLEDFRAIRFWARATAAAELRVQLPNADTDPFGNRCSGTEGDNACYAHFSHAFAVAPEWREVTIRFDDLRQVGAGRRAESFDRRRVFSVFFVLPAKRDLGLFIDDVALVK